jgi:hypothetical protein
MRLTATITANPSRKNEALMTYASDNEQEQRISDEQDLRKYYSQIVHMADDDLDLYEYRLYGHYKRVCGQAGGICNETERTTYLHCSMGWDKFIKVRASLIEKGYIRIVEEGTPNTPGIKGTPTVIACPDLWPENFVRYAQPEKIAEMQKLIGEPKHSENGPSPSPDDDKHSENGPKHSENGPNASPQSAKKNEYLEESKNPITAADAGGSRKPMTASERYIMNGMTSLPGSAGIDKDQGKSFKANDDIKTHPLVKFFMEKIGYQKLTAEMENLFTDKISYRDESGNTVTSRSLLAQWDHTLGFDEFAKGRIAELLAMKQPTTPVNILKHLRKLNKDDGKIGFREWSKKNPTLCNPVQESAPAEVKMSPAVEDEWIPAF